MKNSPGGQAELRKLQAAWRRAASLGLLEIPCLSLSDARKLRFTLYNAVKAVKEGKVHDPEFLDIVNSVSISLQESPPMVRMQHRASSSMMQSLDAALDAALGGLDLDEAPIPPVMTKEEAESLAKIQELVIPESEAPIRATPYYQREG